MEAEKREKKKEEKEYFPGTEEKIRVYGRTKMVNPLPLFWTASGIEFLTDAADCLIEVSSGFEKMEQWIRIEVNGVTAVRMGLPEGKTKITVFRGMTQKAPKRIRFYKEAQALSQDRTSWLTLDRVLLSDGELLSLPALRGKIEFIGDSITSGEGLGGDRTLQAWMPEGFTTWGNYAVRTAEELCADFRIVSQCGWGVYSGWDNNMTGCIPAVYDQVCGPLSGGAKENRAAAEEYDFSLWKADAVVIHLGANDDAAFHSPAWTDPLTGIEYRQRTNPDGSYEAESLERFEKAYGDFLEKVRERNPEAAIICVYGMYGQPLCPVIENLVRKYCEEKEDHNVRTLRLPALTEEWTGGRDHPGRPAHENAAKELIEELKKVPGFIA